MYFLVSLETVKRNQFRISGTKAIQTKDYPDLAFEKKNYVWKMLSWNKDRLAYIFGYAFDVLDSSFLITNICYWKFVKAWLPHIVCSFKSSVWATTTSGFVMPTAEDLNSAADDNGDTWAVLIAGSDGFFNYRSGHSILFCWLFSIMDRWK